MEKRTQSFCSTLYSKVKSGRRAVWCEDDSASAPLSGAPAITHIPSSRPSIPSGLRPSGWIQSCCGSKTARRRQPEGIDGRQSRLVGNRKPSQDRAIALLSLPNSRQLVTHRLSQDCRVSAHGSISGLATELLFLTRQKSPDVILVPEDNQSAAERGEEQQFRLGA